METESFRKGINELLEQALGSRTAIMCAEALWWRCHRSLISDYLSSIGVTIHHIVNARKDETHSFTTAARLIDGQLSYRGLLES